MHLYDQLPPSSFLLPHPSSSMTPFKKKKKLEWI